MSRTADAPLKVSPPTKERVRLGAAVLACTQGELVDRAVAEFIEAHAGELSDRVAEAKAALLGGTDAAARYLIGEQP
jgi:hypothetical protein